MYNVLVADDESAIRNGLKVLIDWESIGFEVKAVAANGYEAQKVLNNTNIDVVITDIRMPKVDGLELAKDIQQMSNPADVIIISGYKDFEYAQRAIKYGVRNYLLKPIDQEQLIETLEDIKKNRNLSKIDSLDQKDSDIIFQIKQLVAEQYNKDITLNYIAQQLNYNPVYLGRVFVQETGKSFRDYLKEYRINESARLLIRSRLKVHEISEKVGYQDYNYFCRVFKDFYNLTPSEFREGNCQQQSF